MKRKGFDEVCEDFSPFSLSAPASKIRRLDGDLPFMEEQCIPLVIEQQPPEEEMRGLTSNEAFSPPAWNEERALVVYRPPEAHLSYSFKIDPKLFGNLKNYKYWPENSNAVVIEEAEEHNQSSSHNCLAIVPWVSSQVPVTGEVVQISSSGNERVEEQMEAEGSDAVMEIEEDLQPGDAGFGSNTSKPWHHYIISQAMQNTSAPLLW
ncbi:hypothetical protein HPP92_017096 [Vanilla planifolia]|uniref:Uncharacterized protein n=1 Tax=Vanilla planifolia TaxID=51239 RepID=A0A835USS5_VANPL|nr:hypothetical protein HPP92_017096 [Vanilla planifolia]